MSDRRRRRPFEEFLEKLPAEADPDAIRSELDALYDQRDVLERKRATARGIDRNRAPTADDDALAVHVAQDLGEQLTQPREEPDEATRRNAPSRRERRRAAERDRRAKAFVRLRKHLEGYKARLRELGQHDADPVGVPPAIWRLAQMMMADGTSRAVRVALASLPPDVARRIRKAALRPLPYRGRREQKGRELRSPRRDVLGGRRLWWEADGQRRWQHPAAIRTAALGIVLYRLGRRTRRDGFRRVVRGIPRRLLCALLQDPATRTAPSVNAVFGNMEGVPSAARALEQSGLFLTHQPPGSKVSARDRGPSGFAFNNYWFPSRGAGTDAIADVDDELPPDASLLAALLSEPYDPPLRGPTDSS